MHDNTKELYSSLQSLIQTTSSIPDAIKLIQSVEKLAAATTDIDQVFTALEIAEQIIYTSTTYDEIIAALDFAHFIAAHDYYLEPSEAPSHSAKPNITPDTEPNIAPVTNPPIKSNLEPKATLPEYRSITPATLSDQAEATLANLRYDGYSPEIIAKQIRKTPQWVGLRTGKRPVSTAIVPDLAELILAIDWKIVPKAITKSTEPTAKPTEPTPKPKPAEPAPKPTKPATNPPKPTEAPKIIKITELPDPSTMELESLLESMPDNDTKDSPKKESLLSQDEQA